MPGSHKNGYLTKKNFMLNIQRNLTRETVLNVKKIILGRLLTQHTWQLTSALLRQEVKHHHDPETASPAATSLEGLRQQLVLPVQSPVRPAASTLHLTIKWKMLNNQNTQWYMVTPLYGLLTQYKNWCSPKKWAKVHQNFQGMLPPKTSHHAKFHRDRSNQLGARGAMSTMTTVACWPDALSCGCPARASGTATVEVEVPGKGWGSPALLQMGYRWCM